MEDQHSINETLIFELEPIDITINNELPRQRKDIGDINELANSFKRFGQIQPIVINRNNELIVGGRRLAACMVAGIKVKACYKDTVDTVLMREMELEENLQRKDLTPAEEALAVAELVTIKQTLYGKSTSGREGGFSLDDVAASINKSRGYIIEKQQLAVAVTEFPDLAKLTTASDIKKAYKAVERVARQVDALASYEATITKSNEFILVNRPAESYLKGLGSESIDLFFTDPPYGIDIHDIALTLGGETGGDITTTSTKYEDNWDAAKALLEVLIQESYRITKDTGHAYFFCGRDRFIFQWIYDTMTAAGWIVLKWPIIWVKRETGQNNQPDYWPSSAYEAILFARKPNSRIVIPGKPDWIQCDPVLSSIRVHQAEKPVLLCKELISRVCMPGQYLVDPCMGSGSIIEAGVQMKVLSMGCEKELESYAMAVSRLTKMKEGK